MSSASRERARDAAAAGARGQLDWRPLARETGYTAGAGRQNIESGKTSGGLLALHCPIPHSIQGILFLHKRPATQWDFVFASEARFKPYPPANAISGGPVLIRKPDPDREEHRYFSGRARKIRQLLATWSET
ncbi:hypothetical protein EVAR_16607_1 [Eumeta japonica]|uniref:Uncharacterized protein n=1 Tax=Eumeta variegata TaxID=151549 RepID=A0A4C1UZA4_EUMVA|nr:hypothetical protein EVAR_16607_1 [Eumeta japonica]